jgi:peptide/nickel transport system ATP-binding protein
MLLITHDLGVVAQNCDHVAIMYAGEIVEYGSLRDIFKDPRHPYTIGLLSSIPSLAKDVERLTPIKGLMPDPTDLPVGCKFHTRCNYASDVCKAAIPPLDVADNAMTAAKTAPVKTAVDRHLVRCVYAKTALPQEAL